MLVVMRRPSFLGHNPFAGPGYRIKDLSDIPCVTKTSSRQLLDRRLFRRNQDGAHLYRRSRRSETNGLSRSDRRAGADRDPGISVANAPQSTQGLPNVNPVYTGVRLAQRVPVRIRITHVPADFPLVSGMTVTVTIRGGEARERSDWLRQRFASLVERLNNVVYGPQPSAGRVPRIGHEGGTTVTLPTPQPSAALTPETSTLALPPS